MVGRAYLVVPRGNRQRHSIDGGLLTRLRWSKANLAGAIDLGNWPQLIGILPAELNS